MIVSTSTSTNTRPTCAYSGPDYCPYSYLGTAGGYRDYYSCDYHSDNSSHIVYDSETPNDDKELKHYFPLVPLLPLVKPALWLVGRHNTLINQ